MGKGDKPTEKVKTVRFQAEDLERLAKLKQAMRVSEADLIRLGLRELARKEGLE